VSIQGLVRVIRFLKCLFIVTEAYDFAVWHLPRVQGLSGWSRFVLGDPLIAIYVAFSSKRKNSIALRLNCQTENASNSLPCSF